MIQKLIPLIVLSLLASIAAAAPGKASWSAGSDVESDNRRAFWAAELEPTEEHGHVKNNPRWDELLWSGEDEPTENLNYRRAVGDVEEALAATKRDLWGFTGEPVQSDQ